MTLRAAELDRPRHTDSVPGSNRFPVSHARLCVGSLRFATAALLCAAIAGISGCGTPGSPMPPSLKLPVPPSDLSASRVDSEVSLHWTMPRRATDRVLLTGDQRVTICRSLEKLPCERVGVVLLQAGLAASYVDRLPASLTTGSYRLLTYTVLLENPSKHTAGPSNEAYTAAGAAPPQPLELSAAVQPTGVILHWKPEATARDLSSSKDARLQRVIRLHRSLVLAAAEIQKARAKNVQAGVPQPLEQTLELASAPLAGSVSTPDTNAGRQTPGLPGAAIFPDHAIDADAAPGGTYKYVIERVDRVTLDGRSFEIASLPSAGVTVEARDTFAPATPAGLQAVADAQGGAIDLSWTEGSEPDLAGYIVYRRAPGESDAPVRVSGSEPLTVPGWRDSSATVGQRYAYSVSAVDRSGNESARSDEAVETLTAPQQ